MNRFGLILLLLSTTALIFALPQQEEIQQMYEQFENDLARFCYTNQFAGYASGTVGNAIQKNLPQNMQLQLLNCSKPFPAYDKVAHLLMVKDEADIIFENLCWHYYMGFRKFIIIDNGSTDDTVKLINLFKKLTAASASVIMINDLRIAYLQTSRMNGCVKLAEKIWPEITWIFPNDADEFITLNDSLENSLCKVPQDVNCIHSPRITYIPTNEYFEDSSTGKFYDRIQRAHKKNPYGWPEDSPYPGKTCIRAHKGLLVTKGNHVASEMSAANPWYLSGLECGMHIREYPLRSPAHALKKIVNFGIAEENRKKIYKEAAWQYYADVRYQKYLEIGDAVGLKEFKNFMTQGGYSFDERMPIELALREVISLGDPYEFIFKELSSDLSAS